MSSHALSDEDFHLFQQFLVTETGLYFDNSHAHSLADALNERRQKRGHTTFKEYYHYLRYHLEGRGELKELLVLITTGETYFFRNVAQFDVLMKDVLPEIIARKRAAGETTIKIWSAGSSRGDEAYSVAIALMEVLPEYRDWKIMIQGTDINRDVLAAARAAVYTTKDIGELPPEFVEKYFVRQRAEYVLNVEVKSLAWFQYHNMVRDSFAQEGMQGVDIIFCRNVTIYFNMETTKALIGRFYDSLLEGGYLFLGHSETLWQFEHQFKTVEYPHTFIYKKERRDAAVRKLPAERLGAEALSPPRSPIALPSVRFDTPSTMFSTGVSSPTVDKAADQPLKPGLAPGIFEKNRALDFEMKALLLEATFFYHNKKYTEALVRLDRIIAGGTTHLRANLLKAVICADQEKYDEAVMLLEQIVTRDNLHVEATLLLATLKVKTGKLSEAETFFRRVMYISPQEPLAYFHLGNVYLAQKKPAKAHLEFKNAAGLLEKRPADEPVPFSEGLSFGVLLQVCRQNMSMSGGTQQGSGK